MQIDDFLANILARSTQHNCFYHFTDRANLPTITQLGGLYSKQMLDLCGIEIAAPGGNQLSIGLDKACGMDRYVHLSCTDRHPMVYAAQQEGRLANAVYLKIAPEILRLDGVKITLDVSNKSGVTPMDVEAALCQMDTEVLYTKMNWSDPAVNARLQSAKKYEILVPCHIALQYIRNPNG